MKIEDEIGIMIGDIVECKDITILSEEEYQLYVDEEIERLEQEENMDPLDAVLVAKKNLASKYITTGIQAATYPGPVKYDMDVIKKNFIIMRYKNRLLDFEKFMENNLIEEVKIPPLYPFGDYPDPFWGKQYFHEKYIIFLKPELNSEKAKSKLFELTRCSSYEDVKYDISKKMKKAKALHLLRKISPQWNEK